MRLKSFSIAFWLQLMIGCLALLHSEGSYAQGTQNVTGTVLDVFESTGFAGFLNLI